LDDDRRVGEPSQADRADHVAGTPSAGHGAVKVAAVSRPHEVNDRRRAKAAISPLCYAVPTGDQGDHDELESGERGRRRATMT